MATWYRKSAEQGFAPAQDALGQVLGFFPEYAHEPFEAEKWLFQAARQGEGAAGERLLEAIEIDVQRASYRPDADILQWLQQQAGSGNAKAKELLVRSVGRELKQLNAGSSPSSARYRPWRPSAAAAPSPGSRRTSLSAIMMVGALRLPLTTFGMIEASTTRRRSTPCTRPASSTTAIGSVARPILQVQEG